MYISIENIVQHIPILPLQARGKSLNLEILSMRLNARINLTSNHLLNIIGIVLWWKKFYCMLEIGKLV